MKAPTTIKADLFRTEISILSLLNPDTNDEQILSARCLKRCNISHRKSLFEKKIDEYLVNNYSVYEMADLCNMSLTSFKKRFAKYYKLPPHRWQVKQRLKLAAEALMSEDLSVKELSYRYNFQSESHFIKLFKREYSLTPKQFKNKFRESVNI